MYNSLRLNPHIWDLFTKKEEYNSSKLDKHHRFIYSYSNHKNVLEPEVSKYLVNNRLQVEYPGNKKFAVCLTHDIDEIYPPLSHIILSSAYNIKNFDLCGIMNQFLWINKGQKHSPYINFKEIMDLEEKYNAKSSFYFITSEKDPLRFRYNIEDIEVELGNIIDRGFEVGLHGGYYSYNSLEAMCKEKKRLEGIIERKIVGYRNHYLRFSVPNTWELLSKAGFKYDSTFGYSDMVGFRNGMCHPFIPYNLNKNCHVDILEIPLTIMDLTLFGCTKSFYEAWTYAKKLIDSVEKYNGVITLLWHNNIFSSSYREKWKLMYEKILRYCFGKNAWMTNGEDIYNWWENGYKDSSY